MNHDCARRSLSLFMCSLALTCAAAGASADVTISSAATQRMSCAGGVCAPTGKDAVLNVNDLESLLASGDVTVTTTGRHAQARSLGVAAPLSWSSGSTLSLEAFDSLSIGQHIAVGGTGGLSLATSDGHCCAGVLSFARKGRVSFANLSSALSIDGLSYTLVGSIAALANVVENIGYGNFALADDYNAAADGTYASAPIANPDFVGTIHGLGNTISNLAIDDATEGDDVGLMARLGDEATITELRLTDADVTGAGSADVGVLAGVNSGEVLDDSATGRVRAGAGSRVGGLVGLGIESANAEFPHAPGRFAPSYVNGGIVYNSSADARVSAGRNAQAGGLVGEGSAQSSFASGVVSAGSGSNAGGLIGQGGAMNSYATARVKGGDNSFVGGLIGLSQTTFGDVAQSYSTGTVIGGSGSLLGGLIGEDDDSDQCTDDYWDTTTSGIANLGQGAGNIANAPGITGLTSAQLEAKLPKGFRRSIWQENAELNGGLPFLTANPPPN